MAAVASAPVVGRDRELASICEFVVGIENGSKTLFLDGAAGIGKTTLWRSGVEAAEDASYRVLACRPAELESRLAFSGVIDLFADVEDAVLDLLPAPQRRALEIALLRRESSGAAIDPRNTAVAAIGAVRALARSAPVLIAVDDVQWLDAPSARVMSYVARPFHDERVGLLLTQREGTRS